MHDALMWNYFNYFKFLYAAEIKCFVLCLLLKFTHLMEIHLLFPGEGL